MTDAVKHPWVRGNLVIRKNVLERLEAEARAAYARDEESCGLLVGPADAAALLDDLVPMENRANKLHALDGVTYPRTGRQYFDIHPIKFEREIKERSAAGRPAKVLYHSHLDVGAYFSETDASAATMGGDEPAYDLAYLVTSVRGKAAGDPDAVVDAHKLFVWDAAAKGFVETRLEVSTTT
jgi:[CysO sulfur-carrier protein]-S-L-cysteine hydrolase